MFTNFLKVTIRNLYREKMYAVINISGLSIAIACCLILGLWLRSELTYDRHNIKYKQIFRVVNEITTNDISDTYAPTSRSLGPMLAEDYPEIKGFVRFWPGGDGVLFRHGDKAFYWDGVFLSDNSVFDVFTHNIIYGDPKTALDDPSSIAVCESFAEKYFGDVNPVGETISDKFGETHKITLVFADLHENSHLRYNVLLPKPLALFGELDSITQRNEDLWMPAVYTYLLMPEGYDIQAFKAIADSFYSRHMAEGGKARNATWRGWLQPLTDTHFQTEAGYDAPTGNRFYIYGFAGVAVFILLVACINYMNLATARSIRRSKEVGMRKIVGAGRAGLILQFLGESIFFSLIALFFGLVLVEVALNMTPINELLNKQLTLNLSRGPVLLGWMLVFSLGIGLMSGIYPAIYLSSGPPLSALVKGNQAGKSGIRMRGVLVLIQFIITVSVIACTLLMAFQIRYASHKALGYNKENMMMINLTGRNLTEKIPIIKKELSKNSDILGISESTSMIGKGALATLDPKIENNDGVEENTGMLLYMPIGDNFLKVMGMQLVEGRDFTEKELTDTGAAYIVNETMVKKMGWEEPLGKRFDIMSGLSGMDGRVIGVVKDFHHDSLYNPIEPFVLTPLDYYIQRLPAEDRLFIQIYLVLNISGNDISGTLHFLQKKFEELDPDHPFEYEFLDESLNKDYLSEERQMRLITIFTVICIIISCMGLFGLSAFTTEQRTKEIGIRKVLGATTRQIIFMLALRILLLVLGGAIIGSLVAYFAMDEWLTRFAYHTGINPLIFLLSAIIAAGVAFITVALQSYKTVRANPVEALRYE
ncbi:MAG: ABC transporter permease [Deltaproteobacteria bacterium]|nr:ABC transporter permease [Deltaproteobacteria bacterium]